MLCCAPIHHNSRSRLVTPATPFLNCACSFLWQVCQSASTYPATTAATHGPELHTFWRIFSVGCPRDYCPPCNKGTNIMFCVGAAFISCPLPLVQTSGEDFFVSFFFIFYAPVLISCTISVNLSNRLNIIAVCLWCHQFFDQCFSKRLDWHLDWQISVLCHSVVWFKKHCSLKGNISFIIIHIYFVFIVSQASCHKGRWVDTNSARYWSSPAVTQNGAWLWTSWMTKTLTV